MKYRVEDYRLEKAPPDVFYIPEFITSEEETELLSRVYATPKPKWRSLNNRRLQNWGGVVGKRSLIADNDIPSVVINLIPSVFLWLTMLIDRICDVQGTFPAGNRPNHVLINEYLPGQGIMPHTDGGAYYPMVSTVSLGSHTMLYLYRQQGSTPIGSILVEPRSLLLITAEAYTLLHGIDERSRDEFEGDHGKGVFNLDSLASAEFKSRIGEGGVLERGTRVSLTIRNVPVVNRSLIFKHPI